MTKDSGVYGIPVPSDSTPKDGAPGFFVSHAATIPDATSFYREYMGKKAWTYSPANSQLDPNASKASGGGYITQQFWCKPTNPVTTVDIIVGAGDGGNQDSGKNIEISVTDDPGETACP